MLKVQTIKVFGFQQAAPNQLTFTGLELEKLLNQVYQEGYEDGRSSPKGNPNVCLFGEITTVNPYGTAILNMKIPVKHLTGQDLI